MPERLECEVLHKVRYINTLTFTFTYESYYFFVYLSVTFTRSVNDLVVLYVHFLGFSSYCDVV